MKIRPFITKNIQDSIDLRHQLLQDEAILDCLDKIAESIISCLQNDGKILFCGNGGSAADAQHLAAELSGRYYFDRPPLFAEALHVNTSYLTAVANDISFDMVYSRLVEAIGKKGDVLIALSTSGNSPNIINAVSTAKKRGIQTVAFTGEKGGKLLKLAELLIRIPSNDTPRIQECHMLLGHTICEMVEAEMFPRTNA